MKIVTAAQLLEFIKMQPDDRKVDLFDNTSNDKCGCIMVHYGKDILGIRKHFECGASSWFDFDSTLAELDTCIDDIIGIELMGFQGTYGELKTKIQ
jgi:hypothetical protein